MCVEAASLLRVTRRPAAASGVTCHPGGRVASLQSRSPLHQGGLRALETRMLDMCVEAAGLPRVPRWPPSAMATTQVQAHPVWECILADVAVALDKATCINVRVSLECC